MCAFAQPPWTSSDGLCVHRVTRFAGPPREGVALLRAVITLMSCLLTLASAAASAEPLCAERARVVGHLNDTFQERRISRGITDTGSVVEVFTSESGGWTMILTNPSGTSCLVMSGEAWETLVAVVKAPTS